MDIDIAQYPHLASWIEKLKARPAFAKGLQVPPTNDAPMDDKARDVLFGKGQHQPR